MLELPAYAVHLRAAGVSVLLLTRIAPTGVAVLGAGLAGSLAGGVAAERSAAR